MNLSDKERAILELGRDPVLAHAVLFGEKHADPTPDFHRESLALWHSDAPRVGEMAFRGAAKSTRAEEAICVRSWFQREKNVVILGDSEQRAVERLRAIKHIFETNEYAIELFGVGPGSIWNDGQATLSNGIILQAYGRGQSLRGVKHLEWRPTLIFMDDLEDKESVATPEARNKSLVWYTSTVVPALDPQGRLRMAATPLHPEALAPKLAASGSWVFKTYPIVHQSAKGVHGSFSGVTGRWAATWANRYSVGWALDKQKELAEVGKQEEFDQEYMCQARNPATQVFTPSMIHIVPQVRSYHAVYAMYDPARTTNKSSATTGKAVWSWVGRKLVIWDAFARKMMPDEIVADMFEVDHEYSPVAIGFEETGLNEWALQPIRAAQVQRGLTLPLRPLNAPKGKLDFIRGLQPYFRADEVEFARDLPDLQAQLLGFPSGDIDAPNALAYALRMRLGVPMFDGFQPEHVVPELKAAPRAPFWLALNSDGRVVTAILAQVSQGQVLILADWLTEGDPGSVLHDIVQEASMETLASTSRAGGKIETVSTPRSQLRLVAPRPHFETYDAIGLRAAVRKLPADVQRGGDLPTGREELRSLLGRSTHGRTALQIAERARWTLRAFTGGYARDADVPAAHEGPYRVLMEGLEAFAAMLRGASLRGEDDNDRNYAYTAGGQRYLSARAR